MTFPNLSRKALVALFALLVSVSVSSLAIAATTPQDNKGGVHHSTGQSLSITVLLNGNPVANASVVIHNADGEQVASGMTGDNGVFTTNALDAGDYKVTASTADARAIGNVTVSPSNESNSLTLSLEAK